MLQLAVLPSIAPPHLDREVSSLEKQEKLSRPVMESANRTLGLFKWTHRPALTLGAPPSKIKR